MANHRGSFNSNFGAVAALAGSAIGLGNIWRFPYIAGENGGAAFIFIYFLIILIIGLPLMMTEFSLGRTTGKNIFGAFRDLAPKTKWPLLGILGIICSMIILSFYSVIAGWTLSFLRFSIADSFSGLSAEHLTENFTAHINSPEPLVAVSIFLVAVALIVMLGVEKGIERSNKIFMPVLFLILIVLSINSFTLSGIKEGLSFIFKPDFSKITSTTVLSALGQAFFSMSIGMGCLMTYGSYLRREDSVLKTAAMVAVSDVLIAMLAGIAIFPAVFTYGIEPGSGANLVFITLPNVFAQMTGGYIFGVLFFVLLFLAALTSAVSLMEVVVAYLIEELKLKRLYAVIITAVTALVVGSLCAISQVEGSSLVIGGRNIFDFLDNLSSSYLLTISGFFIVVYAGWFMSYDRLKGEIVSNSSLSLRLFPIFMFIIRYIAPVAIMLIFLGKLEII